jgi:hypothetical protein
VRAVGVHAGHLSKLHTNPIFMALPRIGELRRASLAALTDDGRQPDTRVRAATCSWSPCGPFGLEARLLFRGMRALISEAESETVRRWLRVYAVGAVGVWLVAVWVCVRAAAPRPNAIFAPPLDGLPWAIFGVLVFGAAAVGAVRRRTWGAYIGLFGGLCALAYQVTNPYDFGQIVSLRYTLALVVAAAVVHVPVVALSVRRDALAGSAWTALMVLLAGGASLGWAVGLRAADACHAGPAWQQELACPASTLFWREQGRRAAHSDAARGIYRVLDSGLPANDAGRYREWLSYQYGVETDVLASCLVSRELLDYETGYSEVAWPRLESHLEPFGGWSGVRRHWRALRDADASVETDQGASQRTREPMRANHHVPLDPPPPEWP